jgi:hypothetical protein
MNEAKNPLERFKAFVSEILTVKKEDIDKAEADRRAAFPPKQPTKDDEDESAE